jgi:small-conductance mechanosensitive channel
MRMETNTMLRIKSFLRAWLAAGLLGLCLSGIGLAQSPAPVSSRSVLETTRLELQQVEAAFQREALDDRRLADLRQRLVPLAHGLEGVIAKEQPAADEIKARLQHLGPAPDAAKGQTESPEVALDRAEQSRLWKEADETLRSARALALRIEHTAQTIADRRRQNFTREILAQHSAVASPWLWLDVARALPADAAALHFLGQQWASAILANLEWYEAFVLAMMAGGMVFFLPRARGWVETGSFLRVVLVDGGARMPIQKILRALRRVALATIVHGGLLLLLDLLLDRFELLPGRTAQVADAMIYGLIFITFLRGLTRAVLAPGRPDWRMVELSDERASAFAGSIVNIAIIVVIGRVVDAILAAIVASFPLTVAMRGVFAILVSLTMMSGLRRAFGQRPDAQVQRERPVEQNQPMLPLRIFGWAVALIVLGAALLGFVPLATFLVTQLTWIITLVLAAVLLLVIIEEIISTGLSANGFLGRRVREATGMAASSLDQASVLASGLLRLVLFVAFGMLLLAPWGVDSQSFLYNIRAAFFGFQVGGVTISLSTIAVAILLFTLGYGATRAVQNWLDTHYLPRTTLDPGLQNSIRTILGYVGIVIAAMVALSQLGLSIDKITIVAGALSVGIGFGLKSIVENFISGLILLWERPIRVGDWIVVGDEQGTVKRIDVRSTEILTFDRASVIIPNSEFISGRVKNWVHSDRTARIVIPVGVDYSADPAQVQKLLMDAALAHLEVMSEPKPMVIFKNLGENGLDFELRCFTDVDSMATTRSDLLFDIYRRLQQAGVLLSAPTRKLEITSLPPMVAPRGLPRQDDERDG